MIEVFLNEVLSVVFAKNLNFASKIIIGALDKLVLTLVFMLLNVLSQHSRSAFVVALNDFKETSLVVGVQVLIHDDRCTLLVWTHNASKVATLLMLVEFFAT